MTTFVWHETPAGPLKISIQHESIYKAEFCSLSDATPAESISQKTIDTLPYNLVGTTLQIAVWRALMEIPRGETISYQELAQKIGYPRAWRAVANAVGKNPIAYFIPCHRVIRADGQLGGYKWGISKKKALLIAEK